jgi:transglutaminase-like putative cysteine protease
MIYQLRHLTSFHYAQPVTFVYNALHLKPRTLPWQTLHASSLQVTPPPAILTERIDYFGNHVAFCSVEKQHTRMDILIQSRVEVLPRPPITRQGPAWEETIELQQKDFSTQGLQAYQFRFRSRNVPTLKAARAFCRPSCGDGFSVHDIALDLMQRIHAEFTFDPVATTVTTPVKEVLERKRGVCQDFAHLMLSCLRSIGVAARYTSGYIMTRPPPGQPRLVGADASHAWVGVYCPVNGWLDFDPTNNQIPGDQHITTAWGRDYLDVSPVNGLLIGGGEHQVSAQVDMVPENERIRAQTQSQQQQ